jgi:hypothetical protein
VKAGVTVIDPACIQIQTLGKIAPASASLDPDPRLLLQNQISVPGKELDIGLALPVRSSVVIVGVPPPPEMAVPDFIVIEGICRGKIIKGLSRDIDAFFIIEDPSCKKINYFLF